MALKLSLMALLEILLASCLFSRGQRYEDFVTRTPLEEKHFLVLGFMGGRDSWKAKNQLQHLATKLRAMSHLSLHVETVENQKRGLAIKLIHEALDRNRNGQLESEERAAARLILYGQSFGGAAVVKLARQLEESSIPVLLTVQIDSVGRGDARIPPNVARAACLFQRNGILISGEAPIVAEDPLRTAILGNFEFDYREKKIDISAVPWHKKIFREAHTKMEHDPEVWDKVEELILGEIANNSQ
ncbi:MAG TPA: hypothetical protein VHP35_20870 [Terriglobia bacterium]|nr:hypothetical protein [Terriglobia bacterium]